MTGIWRRKVKKVPSSYTKTQEQTLCEITNKQMTNLSINSPHQVETASEHLEETMKIEGVPDTSRQPTMYVSPKPVSTIGKNDETALADVEFQELRSMQQAFKAIKNWNFLQPENEMEWMIITQDFLKGFLFMWQFPSKEEVQHTFRTIPREHWLIGTVHGTPKLTIKKFRPAGFA